MDTDTLKSLTDLLYGSQPAQIRVAAATAIAAATAGDANAATRSTVASYPALLRRLLSLRGDAAAGRFALTALVNLAEDASAALALISMRAVSSATAALLDSDQAKMWSLHNALLSNLTRLPEGVDALTGEGLDGGERRVAEANLLRLAERLSGVPNALFLANACSRKRGREVLLGNGEGDARKQPLNVLLQFLQDEDKDRRLAAASALRNCALDEDTHAALVGRTDVLGFALVRFMSPGRGFKDGELEGAPREVLEAAKKPMGLKPEPFAEIRLLLVEALLLLCQSKVGREALRTFKAYPILREWHTVEDDEGVQAAVEQIVDRTQLLEDEGKNAAVASVEGDAATGDDTNETGNTIDIAEGESAPESGHSEEKEKHAGLDSPPVVDFASKVSEVSMLDSLD